MLSTMLTDIPPVIWDKGLPLVFLLGGLMMMYKMFRVKDKANETRTDQLISLNEKAIQAITISSKTMETMADNYKQQSETMEVKMQIMFNQNKNELEKIIHGLGEKLTDKINRKTHV